MTNSFSEVVQVTQDYYDSTDADVFYSSIWGGEDIHIGLYESEEDTVYEASRRTVQRVASFAQGQLGEDSKVLDIGAGYGGASRYLAKEFGCHVTSLNLSEVENKKNRKLCLDQGLHRLVDVAFGSFEAIPFEDESFDLVWSQDAILHSGNREKVVQEVSRVLKKGGRFLFTDIMQSDDCPENVLQPILDRIHLQSLGSPAFYTQAAQKFSLEKLGFDDQTAQIANHYAKVLRETELRQAELEQKVNKDYLERMKVGLQHWVDGGNKGHLSWGIFQFQKK
ncbi:MAG: SAM-dependent methyltransferase [SAR324 cluster bacterium]|uniref:SAM-dependent methyltransferase n=1 Tax=SAR324 cluster bacterium TaxID=2024889 RepID=A0A2A4SS24_9DELT|nr:MAG: SAM-dependent methyltransferase [SAR324 cluster bacterium]